MLVALCFIILAKFARFTGITVVIPVAFFVFATGAVITRCGFCRHPRRRIDLAGQAKQYRGQRYHQQEQF